MYLDKTKRILIKTVLAIFFCAHLYLIYSVKNIVNYDQNDYIIIIHCIIRRNSQWDRCFAKKLVYCVYRKNCKKIYVYQRLFI